MLKDILSGRGNTTFMLFETINICSSSADSNILKINLMLQFFCLLARFRITSNVEYTVLIWCRRVTAWVLGIFRNYDERYISSSDWLVWVLFHVQRNTNWLHNNAKLAHSFQLLNSIRYLQIISIDLRMYQA